MERQRQETWTIDDLRLEFERYRRLVNAADLAPTTKTTYLSHADRFVRWLGGEVDIGGEAQSVQR